MTITTSMTATFKADQVQIIIATALHAMHGLDVAPADVIFKVGETVQGYGMSESLVTAMSGASARTTTSVKQSSEVQIGTVTTTAEISLTLDEVKEIIARQVTREAGRQVHGSDVRMIFGRTVADDRFGRSQVTLASVSISLGEIELEG